MRFWIPCLTLIVCGVAIAVEALPHSADAAACRYGLCRFDQMYDAAAGRSVTEGEVAALLEQDPNNPNAWCTYAEYLALRGGPESTNEADAAFEHAIALAPDVPTIAMRAANFYFTHDQRKRAFELSARILSKTASYDEILFSYMRLSGVAAEQLEGTAVPVDQRAAKAWMDWMMNQNAPNADLLSAYEWTREKNITSEGSTTLVVNEFWKRHAYKTARNVWTEWQGAQAGQQEARQTDRNILSNPDFLRAPNPVPFDWDLTPPSSVELVREMNGLDVHFLGKENLDLRGVRQYAAVAPGRYRFTAEVESQGLTTDRTPFFQIEDGEVAARLSASTAQFPADSFRTTVTLDITVPSQTKIVSIQLMRKPSWKFDNKIEGHLRVHSVRLTPLS